MTLVAVPELRAGDASPIPPTNPSTSFPNESRFVQHLLADQVAIWTSPTRLSAKDLKWLVPSAGALTGLIVTDRTTAFQISRGRNASQSKNISDGGVVAAAAVTGGLYLWGRVAGNDRAREAGVLSTESVASSLVVAEALKFTTRRDRPFQDNGAGEFFSGGQSFPSEHATAAWSVAAVLAHEYPGWLTRLLAYGGASAVSLSRVTGKQHFLSDVAVGSAIGYLTGTHIYHARHNPDLEGSTINEYRDSSSVDQPQRSGFTYVPTDNWVYPALERLIGSGYITSAVIGLRPWTREECARMVREAGNIIQDLDNAPVLDVKTYEILRDEFSDELGLSSPGPNDKLVLESLYSRVTQISGRPLNDSYHFGQTIINDFGRPYRQGFNSVDGFTARADSGPFAFYVRGEYQHSPSAPAYPLGVRQVIASADVNPLQPAIPIAQNDQFRLLDSYAAVNLFDNELSIGKQSLWWGPGEGGPLVYSDNAEPIYMLRLNRVTPIRIGPVGIRFDAFLGKLSGNLFPRQAFIHGEHISVKPTQNLELGFSRTAEMGGIGRGLTAAAIYNSYFTFKESSFFGRNDNPGKRTGGFDLSYRVPFVRDWMTVYLDSISADDPSPLAAPRRAAISPGFYLSHLPKLSRLDLRAEGVYTETPSSSVNGHFIYYDFFYHDLYTNKNDIIGSWIGREGRGIQAWSTYWFSPQNSLQVGYRNSRVAPDFIPHGASQNDFNLKADFRLPHDLELQTFVQYENWLLPVLAPDRRSDVTTSVQLTFWPKKLRLSRSPTR